MSERMVKPRNGRKSSPTRRLTLLAFTVAVALVVAVVESFLPSLPLAPGAKLGLSNIAPLFALLALGAGDAFIVMILKCLLSAALSGGISGLMYSLPSGLVSLSVETALVYLVFDKMSVAGISLVGAVVFNCTELVPASLITGVNLVALVPYMIATGVLCGAFTGLLTYYVIKKLPYSVYGQ